MALLIPMVSNYDNDLENAVVIKLMQKLKEAFNIAADGGMNPAVKWGDNDESDAISHLMGMIVQKYQDKMSKDERGAMNE